MRFRIWLLRIYEASLINYLKDMHALATADPIKKIMGLRTDFNELVTKYGLASPEVSGFCQINRPLEARLFKRALEQYVQFGKKKSYEKMEKSHKELQETQKKLALLVSKQRLKNVKRSFNDE